MKSTLEWLEEAEAVGYSATLTGNPMLFKESRLLIDLLHRGMSVSEAKAAISDGNLFQYRSVKSVPKRVNALVQRFSGFPSPILEFLAFGPVGESRMVLLLLLAVRDRLFREFFREIIVTRLNGYEMHLPKAEVERFFESKAAVSPKIASWTPDTRAKLREVYLAALFETGIVTRDREMRVQRPILQPDLRELMGKWFSPAYQTLLGGV